MADSPTMTYGGYLKLDELLACQEPKTRAHDELLFVIIHQVYELWFKQILHEAALLQRRLEEGNSAGSLHTARRIAKILKTVVGQLDVLETMTPRQFAAFRDALGNSSGFQSEQFREIGPCSAARVPRLGPARGRAPPGGRHPPVDLRLAAALPRRSRAARPRGGAGARRLPAVGAAPRRPEGAPHRLRRRVRAAAEVCEALVDVDEGIQEWRYRHLKMVERTIGAKIGTGGSAGADYLRRTLFAPAFPDLWEVRSQTEEVPVHGG